MRRNKVMTYEQYRQKQSDRVNALPIFFAFSERQLDEQLAKRNATVDDIYQSRALAGAMYLKKDAPIIREYLNAPDELPELMNDFSFAVEAFEYEMYNHEYAINTYQGDWDVLNCFSDKELEYSEWYGGKEYLEQMGHLNWLPAYKVARSRYYRDCPEY